MFHRVRYVCAYASTNFVVRESTSRRDRFFFFDMPCNFPLYRADLRFLGSVKLPKFINIKNDAIVVNRAVKEYLVDTHYLKDSSFIPIPCGQCIVCRLAHSKMWAQRLVLESLYHDKSYFLTLTYDDDHLPSSQSFIDPVTGQIADASALDLNDAQLFLKRLRFHCEKKYHKKLRFFLAGEYGEKSFRPHYHAIIFGLPIPDLKFFKGSNGFPLYESAFISSIWQKGYVLIGESNADTCAYTASYVTKKAKGRNAIDKIREQYADVPGLKIDRKIGEFATMSRRPGIGKQYFLDHAEEIYKRDSLFVPGMGEAKPTRYFDNLFDLDHHFDLLNIKKERRALSEVNNPVLAGLTDLSEEEYFAVKERFTLAKVLAKRKSTI